MNYQDFQNALINTENRWRDYRNEITNAFAIIVNSFSKYLNLPDSNRLLKYTPPDRTKYKENTNYTIHGAIKLEDDGWATLGLLLLLERDKNTHPKRKYIFNFQLKKKNEKWLLKGFKDGPEIEINTICWRSLFQFLFFKGAKASKSWGRELKREGGMEFKDVKAFFSSILRGAAVFPNFYTIFKTCIIFEGGRGAESLKLWQIASIEFINN